MSTIPVEKFEAFENYNFDNDEQFQTGLKSLAYNEQENNAELLQRAKLFYYTKYRDSFDIDEYLSWRKAKLGEEPAVENKEKKSELEGEPPRFSFQELVDMIEKGIEIPGIKQIPNVLNEGTPSQPKMTARPKPWEINKNSPTQ